MRATERAKLVLVVIDGLTPALFESAVATGRAPWLALLAERGDYGRAVSVFPSLTPVCLSSIATGAYPDVHRIPGIVWYHREEQRVVEYGSSFGAIRAAGTRQSIRDAIFNMNALHLGSEAVTVFEALDDAGLRTAAVNMTCYRGRTRHVSTVPGWRRTVYGPKRFFYYSLFESDVTGAPLAVRSRPAGTIDGYAAAVGRWLVTRDGFDFLFYYLPDFDFASHAHGPSATYDALARADDAVGALIEAAGGIDGFLERYALVFCSDHGQSHVEQAVRLQESVRGVRDVVVTASNRAGMVYRLPGCSLDARDLAERVERERAVAVVLFREGDEAVARRDGEELRFAPNESGFSTSGDPDVLAYPNALERAWTALANPNAGDLIVSAAPGWEFADLGGRHHAGGGSHGSLDAQDSEVPVLTVGVGPRPASITGLAPLVLSHFGVEPPAYVRAVAAPV